MTNKNRLFPAPAHDHRACRASGLALAESVCTKAGARLTENRRKVLEQLWSDHVPLSAYEIAERIDWQGRRGGPVQVYRALEFFVSLGLVHRIESKNAYLACAGAAEAGDHGAQFLVCEDCGQVAETQDEKLTAVIADLAKRAGFLVKAPVIEVRGLCPGCQDQSVEVVHGR